MANRDVSKDGFSHGRTTWKGLLVIATDLLRPRLGSTRHTDIPETYEEDRDRLGSRGRCYVCHGDNPSAPSFKEQ
jgi:hypothetical protein